MICDRCYKPSDVGEHGHMLCPLESRRRAPTVWVDDIPGGIEITNGICNEDGTPKRYYSKTEIRDACLAKGMMPYHEIWQEGGNKILADARHRDEWLKSGEAQRARRDREEYRREGGR